jgi:hypothetical protein
MVLATCLHGLLRSASPYTLESLFVSDSASSFYGVSQQHEASDVLRHFNRIRLQAPWHAQSNMPGKLMLVYALRLVSERTDVLPWLIVVVSNLGAALMYLFVRDLFEDRRAALFSAALYLFVPARIFFFPIMNTVTPVAVLCCACLLLRWLRSGKAIWAILLGVALYGLVFFEPVPLVMALLGAGLAFAAIAGGSISWERVALQSAVVVLVFVATSELIHWWSGFEIVRAFRQLGGHAVEFNATEGRPYWVWVRANLVEFLVGVGACQAVMFCGALFHGLSGGNGWRERMTRPITVVCLSLLAVLLALDVMGVNRGEVVRLWIFLACFFQIPAAYVCSTLGSRAAMVLVVSCTVFEAALGTAMIGFVVP